jgi:hypothetical protein
MIPDYNYGTISEAIHAFRKEGYLIDFNLDENCIRCTEGKFIADDFEIKKVFRYEGNTDPADEAAVYAIESKSGIKGILVAAYGAASDAYSADILSKLRFSH